MIPIPAPDSNDFVKIVTDVRTRHSIFSPFLKLMRDSYNDQRRIERTFRGMEGFTDIFGRRMLDVTLFDAMHVVEIPEGQNRLPFRKTTVYSRFVSYARANSNGRYLSEVPSAAISPGSPPTTARLTPPAPVGSLYTRRNPDTHLARIVAAEIITPSAVEYRPPPASGNEKNRRERVIPVVQPRLIAE